MRQFLAVSVLAASMVALSACTGNSGSANLIPKTQTSSLGAFPASLGAFPASLGAFPASLDAAPI